MIISLDTIKIQLERDAMPLVIFIVASLPRVLSLGTFVTNDEILWMPRSTTFIYSVLTGNWAGTYLTSHPGVTTMWISGIPLSLLTTPGLDYSTQLMIAELPIAITVSVCIMIMYYLLSKVFDARIAAISALFIALDPFYIAHSRVIHVDALLTSFTALAALSMIVYLNQPGKNMYLYLASIFTGFAALTKLPSIFLYPYLVMVMILWYLPGNLRISKEWVSRYWKEVVKASLIFIAISVALFIMLWPSMWVQPIYCITQLISSTDYVLETPHGSGFFMKNISDGDYPPTFYPIMLLMRLTPITLIFSAIGAIFLAISLAKNKLNSENKNILFLTLFILLFGLQMTIGSKKGDRYLLPVFPFVDMLAAYGVFNSVSAIIKYGGLKVSCEHLKNNLNKGFIVVIAIILLLQVAMLAQVHPYYLSYYDPIFTGGSSNAANMTVVGWGEGMDQAAMYLNEKPGAQNLTVAAEYSGFQQYFKGKTVSMDNATGADYIVFYVGMVVRHMDYSLWQQYSAGQPEKVIRINNIDYCWIYPVNRSAQASLG